MTVCVCILRIYRVYQRGGGLLEKTVQALLLPDRMLLFPFVGLLKLVSRSDKLKNAEYESDHGYCDIHHGQTVAEDLNDSCGDRKYAEQYLRNIDTTVKAGALLYQHREADYPRGKRYQPRQEIAITALIAVEFVKRIEQTRELRNNKHQYACGQYRHVYFQTPRNISDEPVIPAYLHKIAVEADGNDEYKQKNHEIAYPYHPEACRAHIASVYIRETIKQHQQSRTNIHKEKGIFSPP
jgi:hypothetical protein